MKIKGENITLSDLFDSKKNHKSIAYGLFGITHLMLSAVFMGIAWQITLGIGFYAGLVLMVTVAILTSYWWYRKETKKHTVSLFKERSTPFVTLDTRLDFFTPAIGVIGIVILWGSFQ